MIRELMNGVSRLAIYAMGGPRFPRIAADEWEQHGDRLVIMSFSGPSNTVGATPSEETPSEEGEYLTKFAPLPKELS